MTDAVGGHHPRAGLTEFASLDGLRLKGTLEFGSRDHVGAAVLVHGGGVTRDEGGFFSRLAAALQDVGIASLRFDFRGHGQSEGRQEELTLAGVANDIQAAEEHLRQAIGGSAMHLIGTSFGGGISALYAGRHPERVRSLVLLNPLLDYKKRIIDEKPYWVDDHISDEAGRRLLRDGYLPHSPSFKLGRPLLNEVFYLQPERIIGDIAAPTLIVHGTRDTFIPVDSSRRFARDVRVEVRLVEVEGAQHGFAVHDDPEYRDPQTAQWQAMVIGTIRNWILDHL